MIDISANTRISLCRLISPYVVGLYEKYPFCKGYIGLIRQFISLYRDWLKNMATLVFKKFKTSILNTGKLPVNDSFGIHFTITV